MDEIGNFLNGLTLLGIPAIVLLPIVLEYLKRVGMDTRWVPAAALLIGVVIAGLAEAVSTWPAMTPWVRIGVAGVLLAAGAMGVYSQAKYQIVDPRAKAAAASERLKQYTK